MNLVVPADFTKASRSAALYAAGLAEKTGDGVILLHVYSPPVSMNNTVWPLDREMSVWISEETDRQIATYFSDVFKSPTAHMRGKTRVGRLTDEIVMEAAEDSPSMIVMATREDGVLHAVFRGSNTSAVIESTRSPVLVVPEGIKPRLPAKVAFATDCHLGDIQSLEKLSSWCEKLNAELMLLNVETGAPERDYPNLSEFTWRIRDLSGYDAISCHALSATTVTEGLLEFVKRRKPDLIAFSLRRTSIWNRLFKRTLAEKIIGKAGLPLLLFPSRNHP